MCVTGYQPSAALMERLTPRRAEILTDLNHPWGLKTPAHLRGRYISLVPSFPKPSLAVLLDVVLLFTPIVDIKVHLHRHSPRSSTRQPAPGEEVEPIWLVDEENDSYTATSKL